MSDREARTSQGAIVGFGAIAAGHIAAYSAMPDVSIRGIVDPSPARREAARQMLPDARVFETIEELAGLEELQFVDVCSPPRWHAEHVLLSLSLGHHVLCEKPFVLTVEECQAVRNAAARGSTIVYPIHNYKFSPLLRFMKELIQAEMFGPVMRGHFRTLRADHARGVSEWQPDWRRDPAIGGGGILRDHGTHAAYLAGFLSGMVAHSVSCIAGQMGTNEFDGTEDTALVTIRFGADVEFRIDLSWASRQRTTSYWVMGAAQTVYVEDDQLWVAGGEQQHRRFAPDFDDPTHKAWFHDMFQDFRDVVANPGRQEELLQEAEQTVLVVGAAYRSAASGGAVVSVSE